MQFRVVIGVRVALGTSVALLTLPQVALAAPHVRHAAKRASIVDGRARELLLRGVAVNGLIEYNRDFAEAVPVRGDDVHEMAALGFDFLRLPISWSRLEPAPGHFSRSYLDRIASVVHSAERDGLYVLVDLHQDRYNRHTWPGNEVDGAPDWATQTDGAPCTEIQGVSTLCAEVALQHFWNDDRISGKGLQEHFLDVLLAVSRRLRHDRRLLGLELVNEPTPGFVQSPTFERTELWPFYKRMIAGLRRDGERRMIWFEPSVVRDVTDADPGESQRFSDDPNLVYAPHIYTDVFTPPNHPYAATPARLLASYRAAEQEANAYGAALVDDEWGGGAGGAWEPYRAQNLDLQDRFGIGSGFWIWKQRLGFYNWYTVKENGGLRSDSLKAQQLSRPHVDAVPGALVATRFAGGRLVTRLSGPGGTAVLWSGTVIRHGSSLLRRALTRVLVDGRRTRATVERRHYSSGRVTLEGYRVTVRVRRGAHTITLVPAPSRGTRSVTHGDGNR